MTGHGPTHRDRNRASTTCPKCDKSMQYGRLLNHLKQVHRELPGLDQIPTTTTAATSTRTPTTTTHALPYIISVPNTTDHTICPISQCANAIKGRHGMRRHFNHRHFDDSILIIEEGYLPKCPQCGIQCNLTTKHLSSKTCSKGAARIKFRTLARERPDIMATTFTVNGATIETVPAFKYLGRWLRFDDDDQLAVMQNIKSARKRWFQMSKILTHQNASPKAMGRFYLAAVQLILLYGAESWTLTTTQLHLLEAFHHHCARHITHSHIRPLPNGEWVTPHNADVLEKAGLQPILTYIKNRREHITPYTRELPIYTKCTTATANTITAKHTYWWLLPNDAPLTPIDHSTSIITNPRRTAPRNPYYNHTPLYRNHRYAPRPTTILLNDPSHPSAHITYTYRPTHNNISHTTPPHTTRTLAQLNTNTNTHTHPSNPPSPTSLHTNHYHHQPRTDPATTQ